MDIKTASRDEYDKHISGHDDGILYSQSTIRKAETDRQRTLDDPVKLQIKFCQAAGMDISKSGEKYIGYYRELKNELMNVKAEEIRQKLEDTSKNLESTFITDFVAQINENIKTARHLKPADTDQLSLFVESNETLEILRCLDFILNNKDEILEREMSIELFGDSKLFEKEFKNKVCSLLESYCEIDLDGFSDDEKNFKKEKILSHFVIVKNPTYFYSKGNGQIIFKDGTKIELLYCRSIALRSDSIEDIASVTVSCETIMTIENLTSFNRVYSEKMFCLFLSGYNNSCKTKFLKKMFENNSHKEWLHFGDIDPDGFLIPHNLRIKTGIDFKPYRMGITELTDFKKYCKPLEGNDITKAKSM